MAVVKFPVINTAARRRLAAVLGWLRCCECSLWVRNTIAHLSISLDRATVARSAGEPPVNTAVTKSRCRISGSYCSKALRI